MPWLPVELEIVAEVQVLTKNYKEQPGCQQRPAGLACGTYRV